MQTFAAGGARLTLAMFAEAYRAARKLAPARFLTLRIHPQTFITLKADCEQVSEIVQIGEQVGHLGKKIIKVACVKAANGLGDGVTVNLDEQADPSKVEFQIHGTTECELVHLHVEPKAIERESSSRCIQ